ncbi:MAG: acyl carrier protein [Rhodospirillales bacterium]|jgi:acyl carrier protein|nr:acyl carrier protein [Rhodospirillales bacterium]
MTDAEILQGVTDIFRDVFGDDDLVLTPDMTADDIDDWDSFNHINIMVATEVRFGIKFQTAEVEPLRNVGELLSLIRQKLSVKA